MRWCFRDSPQENQDFVRCFFFGGGRITLILITSNHRNTFFWPKCNCISLWFKGIDVTLWDWAKFLISKTWNAVSASCGLTQSLVDSIWWFQQEKTYCLSTTMVNTRNNWYLEPRKRAQILLFQNYVIFFWNSTFSGCKHFSILRLLNRFFRTWHFTWVLLLQRTFWAAESVTWENA